MNVRSGILIVLSLTLWACVGAPTDSAAPSTAPAGSVAASIAPSSPAILLHHYPADLACDAIGVDYTTVTFHVDPAAHEQVSALTDTGVSLVTYWPTDFSARSGVDRAVRDGAGNVIVTDGDELKLGQRLPAGFGVCVTPAKLYVLPRGAGG